MYRTRRGTWPIYIVDGLEFEAGANDILTIRAGEIQSFKVIGSVPLVQLDVHVSATFIQETLDA